MIYTVESYPWENFPSWALARAGRGSKHKSRARQYSAITSAFDTETTTVDYMGTPQGIVYVWQWAINHDVIVGRTEEDFHECMRRIKAALPHDTWLVVWVHNLSFDIFYLRGWVKLDNVFCTGPRRILRADVDGWLELRCSMLHSGYSLDKWLKSLNVENKKIAGYDYRKKRYPWTPLTDEELEYCTHDVLGIVDAINTELIRDCDTFATIPLTATGYIRRELKRAIKESVSYAHMREMQPDYGLYTMLREAFRGGNVHANRYYAGRIIKNVGHIDRSSSYPDVLVHHLYPVGKWAHVTACDKSDLARCLKSGYAFCARIVCKGVRLRHPLECGCPYIALAKLTYVGDQVETDNGRVLEADECAMTVTDVDLSIILQQYEFDDWDVTEYYKSKYGYLPQSVRDVLIEHYKIKTELKNVAGKEAEYDHSKSIINSAFGCFAQDVGKRMILYDENVEGLFKIDESKTVQELIEAQAAKGFVPYSAGVWCTAFARAELQQLIDHVGIDFVYCDTDSVFYANPDTYDFEWYNAPRRRQATKSGGWAYDPDHVARYMGVADPEPRCEKFATLGAKKYCEIDAEGKHAGELTITIAGLSKEFGAKELARRGGMKRFCQAKTRPMKFTDSGKLATVYNDNADYHVTIDGHDLHITPNVVLVPTEYTLKTTPEYSSLIDQVLSKIEILFPCLDNRRLMNYNNVDAESAE